MTATPKTKNPLRQLASAIVHACQADGAKGVKQTTVLKTLTEQAGFRSIQGADVSHTAPLAQDTLAVNQALPAHMTFLMGILYSSYPSVDLLPISFDDVAKPHLSIDQAGDSLFAFLHATLLEQPEQFINKLELYLSKIDTLATALEQTTFDEPAAQRVFTQAAFPPALQHFIATEMTECADGTEDDERQEIQANALSRVRLDIESVQHEFMCSRHIVKLILTR